MQPKMSIFGALAEASDRMEEEEEEEEEEEASGVQELEWTAEHQQRSVDVLMGFMEHDVSEEATPPAVALFHTTSCRLLQAAFTTYCWGEASAESVDRVASSRQGCCSNRRQQ